MIFDILFFLLFCTGRVEAGMNVPHVEVVAHTSCQTQHHAALRHHTHVDQIHRRLYLAVPEAIDTISDQTHQPS